jgi:hypothetical protein
MNAKYLANRINRFYFEKFDELPVNEKTPFKLLLKFYKELKDNFSEFDQKEYWFIRDVPLEFRTLVSPKYEVFRGTKKQALEVGINPADNFVFLRDVLRKVNALKLFHIKTREYTLFTEGAVILGTAKHPNLLIGISNLKQYKNKCYVLHN